jgi:hypothetical protein
MGKAHIGHYQATVGDAADDKCWWCRSGGASRTREHLFKHCSRWKEQQLLPCGAKSARRRKGSGRQETAPWRRCSGIRDVQQLFWGFWRTWRLAYEVRRGSAWKVMEGKGRMGKGKMSQGEEGRGVWVKKAGAYTREHRKSALAGQGRRWNGDSPKVRARSRGRGGRSICALVCVFVLGRRGFFCSCYYTDLIVYAAFVERLLFPLAA